MAATASEHPVVMLSGPRVQTKEAPPARRTTMPRPGNTGSTAPAVGTEQGAQHWSPLITKGSVGGSPVSRMSQKARGKQPGDKGAGGGQRAQLRETAGPRAREGTSRLSVALPCWASVPPTKTARMPPPSVYGARTHLAQPQPNHRHVDATSLEPVPQLCKASVPAWI